MKFFSVIAAAFLAATASAQLDAVPACAYTCLLNGISDSGCAIDDYVCSCTNQAFIDTSKTCIDASCSDADIATARAALIQLCLDNGVELELRRKVRRSPREWSA